MFSLLNNAHFDSNLLVEQMIKILEKDARVIIKGPLYKNDGVTYWHIGLSEDRWPAWF